MKFSFIFFVIVLGVKRSWNVVFDGEVLELWIEVIYKYYSLSFFLLRLFLLFLNFWIVKGEINVEF